MVLTVSAIRTTPQLARIFAALAGFFLFAQLLARQVSDGEDIGIMIVGTITNKNPFDNVALIKETKSGKVMAVKKGFKVIGEHRVEKVETKYIILKKGNVELLVYQNKFAGEFMGKGGTGAPSVPTPLSGDPLANSDSYQESGFDRKGLKTTVTAAYRDRLISEELSSILMQATAVPRVENGQISGFTLLQIDNGSIYDKVGFKNGDTITSINGTRLNNAGAAIKLLQSLRGSSDVEVEIERRGNKEKMQISVGH